jgi:hypothetical protein
LDDPLDYPQEFNEMMNRKFLFRLKWQKDWRAGSVLEIKDNKEMVDKIEQQVFESCSYFLQFNIVRLLFLIP